MSSKKVSTNPSSRPRNSLSSLSNASNDSLKKRSLPQFSNQTNNWNKNAMIGHSVEQNEDEEDEDNEGLGQDRDRMKTMFMSIWNNVKFGFATKLKTRFSYESPVCLLGQFYHKKLTDSNSSNSEKTRDDTQSKASAIDKFKHDFYSRIWFTYRREFPKLANSNLTTDCGWGCMLRSAQMVFAQALLTHYLGRQWRWKGSQSDKEDMIHRMIVKWFADDPNSNCSPFSVHQLVRFGEHMGKKPGDWYGPASVAHLLKSALNSAAATNPILSNICCYVAHDCTVYIQDVINLCTSNTSLSRENLNLEKKKNIKSMDRNHHKNSVSSAHNDFDIEIGVIANEDMCSENSMEAIGSSVVMPSYPNPPSLLTYGKAPSTFNLTDTTYFNSGPRSLPFSLAHNSENNDSSQTKWRGLIILVPVRLGGERLNPIYIPCVKLLLSHPNCLGIIGGKPKHSLYFIGFQEDKLVYMDPHYCQQSVDVRQTNFALDSFHCDFPRKTPFSCMDPSCAIGFYCQTQTDFNDFVHSMQELLIPPNQSADYPIFVFNEGTNSSNHNSLKDDMKEDKLLRVKHRFLNSDGKVEKEFNGEEFVML